MLERELHQLSASQTIDQLVIATSSDPSDDPLAELLTARGFPFYRGDLRDVLQRYAGAAREFKADVIVRLTGDCPLHTPDTVDEVVSAFLAGDADYASNVEPYTRPDGTDVEVFTRGLLDRANAEAPAGPDREHVTLYMRRSPDVRRLYFRHNSGLDAGHLRWTVDTPDDLEYVRRVWAELAKRGDGPHSFDTIMSVITTSRPTAPSPVANEGYFKSLFDAAPADKAAPLNLRASLDWHKRASTSVPGGAQTYSKSWRQHIMGVSPIYLDHGKGARAWDVDGNEFVDLVQGLLPNILGYANESVDRAVFNQARKGHSFSLAHPLEVELAERLKAMIPCAEMVRFGKNGSDATAGAVRAARAYTRRERVAVCGYHGWQDWYIGTTSRHAGVPESVRSLSHPFPYNDLPALDKLLSSHPEEFAAVIMEPFNFFWPAEGYLAGVKEIAHKHGAVLIFDEICTGFHFGLGGAQKIFNVTPDMATFGKAMGNGYAISCIVGSREIMQIFDDVFVSFTFAGDVSTMAGAMAVLDVLEQGDAYDRMRAAAEKLGDGFVAFAAMAGLSKRVSTHGHPNWLLLRFLDSGGKDDPALRALWLQEVTRRGVLILSTHNICAALEYADVEHVLRAYAAAFKRIGELVAAGSDLTAELDGPIPTPAFRARG
jgi:glutamate-1-semialdehyde 2,1-aminomutase/spore coat polysaccharide biosynthesis protein SpsF